MIRGAVHRLVLPRRGTGHAQRGSRFGVIVQADELLGLSTAIVAPTSTRARPATFRPLIEVDGKATRVLIEQLRAVDVTRLGPQVGVLGLDDLRRVESAMELVLGLRG